VPRRSTGLAATAPLSEASRRPDRQVHPDTRSSSPCQAQFDDSGHS